MDSPQEAAAKKPAPVGNEPEYKQAGPPGMTVKQIAERNKRYWEQPGGEVKENK